MGRIVRLSFWFAVAACLILACVRSASAQSNVALNKVESSASAVHDLNVSASNENGGVYSNPSGPGLVTGETTATCTTMPLSLHWVMTAVGEPVGIAEAFGYNQATVGTSPSNRSTAANCYRYLRIEAAGTPEQPSQSAARATLTGTAEASATWVIPSTETGNTWIQAEIQIGGIDDWNISNDPEFQNRMEVSGEVRVADTVLYYYSDANGVTTVWGTLCDLGVQNHNFYMQATLQPISLTVRQYLAPGQTFNTYTTHNVGIASFPAGDDFTVFTENIKSHKSKAFEGTTYARSRHLEAFVGDP